MKTPRFLLVALVGAALRLSASALTLPVAEDTFSSTRNALTTVAGKTGSLPVKLNVEAFVKFDLDALPVAVVADNVISARLVVFFSSARTPGDVTVHVVTSAWQENVAGAEPSFNTAPATTIPAASVVAKRFAEVDVTALVKSWLNGSVANEGLALATATANVLIGAKEGSGSGYPAVLEILINPAVAAGGGFTFLGGNVGIGTASPGFSLEVRTSPDSAGFVHSDGTRSLGSFLSATNNNASFGTRSNHAFNLLTNNTARLTIDTTGRVGIGTTSPATPLDVSGRIQADEIQLLTGAGSGRFLVSNGSGIASWTNDIHESSGNIGIGLADAAPRAQLHVAAGLSGFTPSFTRSMTIEDDGNLTFTLRVGTAVTQDILFERNIGEPGARIGVSSDGFLKIGRLRFTDLSASSTSFQLFLALETGNFGVKREAATNDFEVEGTASKTTAGDWLSNSDHRIKTGIRDIADARDTLLRLRPVTFRYSEEWRTRHPSIADREYRNFIAQEYREVFPDAVKGSGEYLANDPEEILQIDTYDAQMVAIKAVQDLIRENEALRASVEKLAAENEKLRGRFDAIHDRIRRLEAASGAPPVAASTASR